MKRLSVNYPDLVDSFVRSKNNCAIYNSSACDYFPQSNDFYFRHNSPTWIDITITIFIVGKTETCVNRRLEDNSDVFSGFLWHEIKQCYADGFKDYLLSWNNIVDSCMNILYLSSFALKYYVFYEVRRNICVSRSHDASKPIEQDGFVLEIT